MTLKERKEILECNLELLYDLEDRGKDKEIIIGKYLNKGYENVIVKKVSKISKKKYEGYNTHVYFRKTKLENNVHVLDTSDEHVYSIKNPRYVEIVY